MRVLEFETVLEMLAERCDTPQGAASARASTPSFDPTVVWTELEKTREADSVLVADPLRMSGLHDVAGPLKLAEKDAVLDGASLYKVGESLQTMARARDVLHRHRESAPILWRLGERLPELPRVEGRLLASLDGDGYVRDEASSELASARKKKASAAQKTLERIQSYVSGKTRDLLSDTVYTVRDGRYVIPLKAEHKGKVKGIVHDTSASGSTVYVEPEDIVALGNELRQAEAMERAETERVLRELSQLVGREAPVIRDGLDAASDIDLALARARFGQESGGCLPERTEGPRIEVREGRHPMLPRETCVPVSLKLGGETDVLLITGPNTGGKTVALKTVGLIVAMAQSGMMPLAKGVKFGCFKQIWADIGDEQSLEQSLSTFSGHVKNIAQALRSLVPGALVLLDEVGAGTDPDEGSSLARALLLAFQKEGAKVMASTHYGELKLLAANAPGFVNASMEFDEATLRPSYRLLVGVPGSSHALKIAERYGLPRGVLEEAQSGLSEQEADVAKMIERLQAAERRAVESTEEAERLATRLRSVEKEAESKIKKAEEARRSVRERATEELEALLREIRIEASDVFEALKKDPTQAGFDRARQRLKELQEVGQDFVRESKEKPAERPVGPAASVIVRGASVRISGFTQTGTVLEDPKDGKVLVQAGALKLTCKLGDLTPVPTSQGPIRARGGSVSLSKAMTARPEIHLRQMRAEDAGEELARFLDEAVLAGLSKVRIVHGKGEGVLRKVTHDLLKRHRDVRSYHEAEPEEGGAGVTVAVLK